MDPLPTVEGLLDKLRSRGIALPHGPVRAGGFGDSPGLSQELLALIRSGRKRGGASLLWAHAYDADPVPEAGEIEIVVDHRNEPAAVTLITEVDIRAFDRVTAEFAAREGEGDGSLDHWREAHWGFFGRECRRIGREPALTMPVVCASFDVLHVIDDRPEAPLVLVPFRPEHTKELLRMWRESFEHGVGVVDPHSFEEQERYLMETVVPANEVRVAFEGGRMVGFVAAHAGKVDQLYVRKGQHRRRIGSRLLEWAKDQSGGSLSLFTFERNSVARAFYEKHGFHIVARGHEAGWNLPDLEYRWSRED